MSIVVSKTRLPVTEWQTESGSVVSINNARRRDAKSAVVTLQPIQSGSGDPSPDNIRPISGHTAVHAYDDPKYGGKIWWNQLASLDISDWNLYRLSMSVDGHSVALKSTSDSTNILKRANLLGLVVGHKYVSTMTAVAEGTTKGFTWGIYTNAITNTYTSREIIYKPTSDTFLAHIWDVTTEGSMFSLVLETVVTTSDQVNLRNIQLFDLTAMFGAGNEPTLEQFRALFPHDYYDYNAGTETLVSAVNGDPYRSISVQLGQTVYDGTVDLVSGVGTADMVSQNITTCVSGNAIYARYVIGEYGYIDPSASYCNMLVNYSGSAGSLPVGKYLLLNSSGYNASQVDFCFDGCRGSSSSTTKNLNQEKLTELNNAGTPLQIVYKLATPITFQLSPNQLSMLERYNTIWADEGDIAITYARIHS